MTDSAVLYPRREVLSNCPLQDFKGNPSEVIDFEVITWKHGQPVEKGWVLVRDSACYLHKVYWDGQRYDFGPSAVFESYLGYADLPKGPLFMAGQKPPEDDDEDKTPSAESDRPVRAKAVEGFVAFSDPKALEPTLEQKAKLAKLHQWQEESAQSTQVLGQPQPIRDDRSDLEKQSVLIGMEGVPVSGLIQQPQPHKCPVCDGAGLVSRPPNVAGDVREWTGTLDMVYPCKSCNGNGVLWR